MGSGFRRSSTTSFILQLLITMKVETKNSAGTRSSIGKTLKKSTGKHIRQAPVLCTLHSAATRMKRGCRYLKKLLLRLMGTIVQSTVDSLGTWCLVSSSRLLGADGG